MSPFARRALQATALVALPALALAGCSGSAASAGLGSVDVASTVAIIEMQEVGGAIASGGGDIDVENAYLVVDESGKTSTIKGGKLKESEDGGAVVDGSFVMDWNEDSLFLSQGSSLLWLREGGERPNTTVENVTPAGSFEMAHALEDGVTRVLLGYGANMGGSAFAVARESGTQTGKATGDYMGGAVCGNDAYVFTGDLDAMTGENSGKRGSLTLRKVLESGEPASKEIGFHDSLLDLPQPLAGSMACDGEDLVMIVRHVAQDGLPYARTGEPGEAVDFEVSDYVVPSDYGDFLLTLERWNTTTGERTVRPLAMGTDPAVRVFEVAMGMRAHAPALQEGRLYWIDGLGRLMRTDPQTGQTEAISESLQSTSKLDELASLHLDMHEGVADILVDSTSDPASDRLVRIDLATGKTVRTIDLKNLGGIVKGEASVFVSSLATNPKR